MLGSVLNQVLLHQSIIGLEARAAFRKLGVKPDVIIGCAGGGSNLGGLIAPFMGEKLRGEADYRIVAVEPASCPSFTCGKYAYDFCDTGRICPLAKMYTLGADFIPSPSHAGGLRFHGMSSTLSELYDQKLMEAVSVKQTDVFAAAQQFARGEADYRIVAVESRDTRRDRRGAQVQGRGQGGDDSLRAHRHRLLRHEGIRGVQRRNDERLRAYGRRLRTQFRETSKGRGPLI